MRSGVVVYKHVPAFMAQIILYTTPLGVVVVKNICSQITFAVFPAKKLFWGTCLAANAAL